MTTPSVSHIAPVDAEASRARSGNGGSQLLEGTSFVRLVLIVDAAMLALAAAAAYAGAGAAGVPLQAVEGLILFPVMALVLTGLHGGYRPRMRFLVLDGLARVLTEISLAAMFTLALLVLAAPHLDPAPLIVRAWLFALVYVGGARVLLALCQRYGRRRRALCRSALIVGGGVVGARVARRLDEHPEYGLRPVGFLDADPLPQLRVIDRRAPILGDLDDLDQVVAATGAQHVVLAFSADPDSRLHAIARRCQERGLEVSVVPRLFDSVNQRMDLEHVGGLPLLLMRGVDPRSWQFRIKHALDRVIAAVAMVALAPLLLGLAIAVKLTSPGPVLYRQRRVGHDGREFDLLKFRSMLVSDEPEEFLPREGMAPGGVEGVDRRTGIGKVMREWAVDELPQLFNVLRGEMSLIGPRPERPEYVALFRQGVERYTDRHRVRSGLTGWAQVHGYRGQTSLADRVEWDNFYIENWSLWLDLKILLMTVWVVTRGAE